MSELLTFLLRNPPLYVIPALGLVATFGLLRLKFNYVNHGVLQFSRVTGQAEAEVDGPPATDDAGTKRTIASAAETAAVTAPPSVKHEERPPLAPESELRLEPPPRSKGSNWFDDARPADAYAYFLRHHFNQDRLKDALDWTWDTVGRWSTQLRGMPEQTFSYNRAEFDERQLRFLLEVSDAWRDVRYAAPALWNVEKLDRAQDDLALTVRWLTDAVIRAQKKESRSTREILEVLGAMRENQLRFSSYLGLEAVGKIYKTELSHERK